MNVYVQRHRSRNSFNNFIVKQLGLTMEVSPADWMNWFGWSEMPRWADASLSWFSCHSPKRAAKSIVTEGRHFTVSLEALQGNKNHQNKVRWSMKFHDISLLSPCLKRSREEWIKLRLISEDTKKPHHRPSIQSQGGQSHWRNAKNSANNLKPCNDETWWKEKYHIEWNHSNKIPRTVKLNILIYIQMKKTVLRQDEDLSIQLDFIYFWSNSVGVQIPN